MKYVVISTLGPGVENARAALEVFKKAGVGEGTEATYAATDGKTFVNIVETDTADMKTSSTYAPFFSDVRVIPVVPVDGTWMEAIESAQSNWS